MDLCLEQETWRLAQVAYREQALVELLEQAMNAYRRSPGYSPSTRLHEAQVGAKVLRLLSHDAQGRQRFQVSAKSPGYVEMRAALREHLARYLLRRLVESSHATEPLMEAYLALEVGV